MGGWRDTAEAVKTIRAPVVLKMTGSAMSKIYMLSQFIKNHQRLLLETLAALKLYSCTVQGYFTFQTFHSVIGEELADGSSLVASPHA